MVGWARQGKGKKKKKGRARLEEGWRGEGREARSLLHLRAPLLPPLPHLWGVKRACWVGVRGECMYIIVSARGKKAAAVWRVVGVQRAGGWKKNVAAKRWPGSRGKREARAAERRNWGAC